METRAEAREKLGPCTRAAVYPHVPFSFVPYPLSSPLLYFPPVPFPLLSSASLFPPPPPPPLARGTDFNRKIKIPVIVLLRKVPDVVVGTISPPLKNIPVADVVPDMHDAGTVRWVAKKWSAVATMSVDVIRAGGREKEKAKTSSVKRLASSASASPVDGAGLTSKPAKRRKLGEDSS